MLTDRAEPQEVNKIEVCTQDFQWMKIVSSLAVQVVPWITSYLILINCMLYFFNAFLVYVGNIYLYVYNFIPFEQSSKRWVYGFIIRGNPTFGL